MDAIFSTCGKYRYFLERTLSFVDQCVRTPSTVMLGFIGCNPSIADGETDDHTTRKLIGFATRQNAHGYVLGNLFGYRATDVRRLADVKDPVGPDNDAFLAHLIGVADIIVPCWGRRDKLLPPLRARIDVVKRMLRDADKPVRVFGTTSAGDPLHPLMLAYATPLQPWKVAA
jgi:hypothetical protein